MPTLVERLRTFINDDYAVPRPKTKDLLIEAADRIERLERALAYISTADTGGELFPVGPSDTLYEADGNTVKQYVGPWRFLFSKGDTFLDAVEDQMRRDSSLPEPHNK